MDVSIVHENEGYSLYLDGKFYGTYDSPNQAAMALEEMDIDENE